MHCAKHLDALLYALHLPTSIGNRPTYADPCAISDYNARAYSNSNSNADANAKPVPGPLLHWHQAESCAVSLEQRWVHDIGHHERSSRPIGHVAEFAPGVLWLLLQYDDRRSIASLSARRRLHQLHNVPLICPPLPPVIHDLVINLEDDRETSRFLKELKFKQLFGVYLDGGDKLAVMHVECLDGYPFLSREWLITR